MRVVVEGSIYDHQRHGGITRLYNQLLPALCELEPKIEIELLHGRNPVQSPPSHPRISSIHSDFRPLRLPLPRLSEILTRSTNRRRRERAMKVIEERGRPAVWHAAYYSAPATWRGPVVTMVYDMGSERYPQFFRSGPKRRFVAEKARTIERADVVLCISESTRDDVLQYTRVDGGRLKVVYPACDPVFRRRSESADSALATPPNFLLYVGRRGLAKNFPTLLDAYGRWPQRGDYGLVVVGPAFTAQERQQLEHAGLDESVLQLAGVDDDTLCTLYNRAAALVYPSRYEGFGFPLVEAMVCGCPVAASRVPSSCEVAGEIAVYFEPLDADGLRSALDTLIAEGRDSERTRAGERWVARYSWQRAVEETLSAYRAVLQEVDPS